MYKKKIIISTVLTLIFMVNIILYGEKIEYSFRSGTAENEDVEEPLNDNVKPYEECLKNSNMILYLIKEGNLQQIYSRYASDDLKKDVSQENFLSILTSIGQKSGEIISYKPMQWSFIIRAENGFTGIACIKLVHCERSVVYYQFVFNKNDMTKLIGFGVQPK